MAARKGKGTKIRWALLAAGVTTRPLDADLNLITGLQASEIKGTQELDTTPTGDYESTDDNLWRDGDSVKSVGWTMSISGHVTDSAAQKAELDGLWEAWSTGAPVWIERLRPGDTHWKGGRALIQDPSDPANWDGEQGFSASILGQGELVSTADA